MKTTTKRTTSAKNCHVMFSYWNSWQDDRDLKRLAKLRGVGRAQAVRDAVRRDLERVESER